MLCSRAQAHTPLHELLIARSQLLLPLQAREAAAAPTHRVMLMLQYWTLLLHLPLPVHHFEISRSSQVAESGAAR